MQSYFRLLLTIILVSAGSLAIFAQSTVTGGIGGAVSDPQNAVVPNAAVKVVNVGKNSETSTTTDGNGRFRVANLEPGLYNVTISATGFGEYNQKVTVEVGTVTNVSAALSVGSVGGNTVEVTADAPVVNVESQDFSTNVNQTSINELPISGRRASNFVLLTPATVPDGTFGLISFRGISGLLNNSTIDGGDNNQAFFSEERGRTRINYSISQSAVREFQVNGANYSAEYGRAAGGVVNTVTKSGTNEFHGDLFYYNRNNRNGARNPRAFQSQLVNGVATTLPAKPKDLRQQFGGTIGGPIIKDHVFFFFSYDQQKRNFPGLATFVSGSYLNLTAANRATLTARGLSNTQIDNTLTFLNSLTGETPRKGDQKLFLPKIDWQINQSNLFTATYNRLRWASPAGIQTQAVNNYGRRSFGDDYVKVDSLNLRLQSTLSANVLNEARFQYGRDFEYQFSQTPLPGEPLTASTALGVRTPNVFLTNGLQFGVATFLERPSYPDERRIQFADAVTYTRNEHTFKFGYDINRVSDNTSNLRTEAGGYSYNNVNDFIIDYTNYVTPLPTTSLCATSTRVRGRCYTSNYAQGIGSRGLEFSTSDFNFFFQDNWRIVPRLTLNLGVRYEYERLPKTVLANTSGDAIPNIGRTIAEATASLPQDKNNLGPRIGFAYDFAGDGKTSIRGGYGLYYGRIINSTIYNALINTGNPGGQAQLSVAVTDPIAPVFPNVIPTSGLAFRLGAIQYFQKNFQAPLIYQYDLVFERQIAKNTVVSASYVGSLGRHLPTFFDQNLMRNLVAPTATYTVSGGPSDGQTFTLPQYTRANTTYQQLSEIRSTVKSRYDAFILQANRRLTNGLQFQASYTLAKSTDTGQSSVAGTSNNTPYDLFDSSYDKGPSSFDVRHKFVISAVYAPTFSQFSNNSAYNYVLNGWSIAPIYVLYSGQPYNGTVSGTSLNNTNGDARFPLFSRNAYRLPKLINVDLRLSKRFRFTEKYNLEFLAEGFNIFNRTQIFGVNNTLYTRSGNVLTYNPSFGQVITTDSTLYRERQIQFSSRFQF